ncbi:hypothetical protein [Lacticaseibacillus paracasei]|uniref:hypothetical protein n=1 Tax=Lacticaseibacillus paracasei TaxID=1597 RepID=UPI00124B9434|nr:hypothetical protein [Lacticaseibacillus paracasei]KAB1965852.1 hypothetical protein F8272_07185 [Lacticaseibacillus paracasei]MCT3332747.1 hypothetical protein [Lacticaseibacillus paracasei]
MGAEYRQRYEDHLLRITVLAATHQITVVFAAMAADQWATAGITKKGAVQTASEGIALPLQQLVQAIAIGLIGKTPTLSLLPSELQKTVTTILQNRELLMTATPTGLTIMPQVADTTVDFWLAGDAAFLTVPDDRLQPIDLKAWVQNILPQAHGMGFGPVTGQAALAILANDRGKHLAAGCSSEVAVVLMADHEVAAYHLDAAQTSDAGYQTAVAAAKQNHHVVQRFFENHV